MARQQTVKQSVNQLLSENKALKQEQKMERMKSQQLDLSSDEDSSHDTIESAMSQRMDTADLADLI